MYLGDAQQVPPELGQPAVVDTTGVSYEQFHVAFADKAEEQLRNPEAAWQAAGDRRAYLAENRTWDHSAGQLVKDLGAHGLLPKEAAAEVKGPDDLTKFLGQGGTGRSTPTNQGAREFTGSVTPIKQPTVER
jgi:hypothetical protein